MLTVNNAGALQFFQIDMDWLPKEEMDLEEVNSSVIYRLKTLFLSGVNDEFTQQALVAWDNVLPLLHEVEDCTAVLDGIVDDATPLHDQAARIRDIARELPHISLYKKAADYLRWFNLNTSDNLRILRTGMPRMESMATCLRGLCESDEPLTQESFTALDYVLESLNAEQLDTPANCSKLVARIGDIKKIETSLSLLDMEDDVAEAH
jgi:hypothetical protein